MKSLFLPIFLSSVLISWIIGLSLSQGVVVVLLVAGVYLSARLANTDIIRKGMRG